MPTACDARPGVSKTVSLTRVLVMVALVTAGEAIFLLPFVFGRVFRPTLLDVFGVTNLQLGLAYSTYGFVAMAAYLAGGPLADRFSARRLMALALVTTGVGGVVLATVHTLTALLVLYAWWGLTTILLFWAALIRATRQWGGPTGQGRAYGVLDGGRGLVAALFASVMLASFSAMLPADAATATLADRTFALSRMIWIGTGFTVAVAVMVMLWVPQGTQTASEPTTESRPSLADLAAVARNRAIWLQAIIVVCAYVGYKSIDDISLYARDALGYDDVAAAQLGTLTFWVRPFAALGAGLLADRTRASTMILGCFVVMIAGDLVLATDAFTVGPAWISIVTIAVTCVGVYGVRGLYFALFGEGRISMARTGSAVGVVSLIGYTPDVFMGPLMGWLTDRSPGALGHQHLFGVVALFGVVGVVCTLLFRRASAQP